jgi:hypothetical protein
VINLVFGGIFTNALSGAIATLIGFTGLAGGAAHYAAILAGRTEGELSGRPHLASSSASA